MEKREERRGESREQEQEQERGDVCEGLATMSHLGYKEEAATAAPRQVATLGVCPATRSPQLSTCSATGLIQLRVASESLATL